uniref:CDGSH iron-sulfur domain-containing protein 2 n=1 Tax=Gallus gallus TaxID=9031 RepID=A0A8V0YYL6_CHICK
KIKHQKTGEGLLVLISLSVSYLPKVSKQNLEQIKQGKLQEVSEWLRLLPFLGVLALLGYLAVRPFLPKKKQQKDSLINLKIQKENPKVVNEINIEDLCLTKAYCRCWRSKTFPVCDGSHNKHNELTGDNVGPLILKKKEV